MVSNLERTFRLDIMKKSSTVRVLRHWNRLTRDVESSVQERCGLVSTCPEKGHKNDPRDGTPLLC